jgi:hypothetical protein
MGFRYFVATEDLVGNPINILPISLATSEQQQQHLVIGQSPPENFTHIFNSA